MTAHDRGPASAFDSDPASAPADEGSGADDSPPDGTPSVARHVPGLPFYLVAAFIVATEAARYLLTADRMLLDTAELVLLGVIGAIYAVVGYRISTRVPLYRRVRIAAISVLMGVVGVLLSGVTVGFARLAGDPVFEETFLLMFGGAATATVGLGVGYYYYQFQARYRDLEREFERTKRLSRELSITHRVLRHNLRNELTVIEGHLSLARSSVESDREDAASNLDVVADHVAALETTCEKAGTLASITPTSDRYRQDAVTAVETAVDRVRDRYPGARITVTVPERAPVAAHPRLQRAIEELLENAVEHDPSPAPEVSVRVDGATVDDRIRIEIADAGTGIPAMEVENLGRTEEDPLSHGRGLGLWLAYTIVEASGGTVRFRENSPAGTVVEIDLPTGGTDDATEG